MEPSCPLPIPAGERITTAHGGGGLASARLLRDVIAAGLEETLLAPDHDGAALTLSGPDVVMTTDSYVVQPIVFPGGDIGTLAVCGTVNDLAMCGAAPLYLSLSLILEEGLPLATLRAILASIRDAARATGVKIATGDTKVIAHQGSQGLLINTAGVGCCQWPTRPHPSAIEAGDVILLSGDVGRHGIAVMAHREGLQFGTTLQSDVAPLWDHVSQLHQLSEAVHCLRDLTRGGLATALYELAQTSGLQLLLREADVPVCDEVKAACTLLGLDPLFCANEGRYVAILPEDAAAQILARWPASQGPSPVPIGLVQPRPQPHAPPLLLENTLGVPRILRPQSGEQLPRIC